MTFRTEVALSQVPYCRPLEATILTVPKEIFSIILETVSMETISSIVLISKSWRDRFVTHLKMHFEFEVNSSLQLIAENLGQDAWAENIRALRCNFTSEMGLKKIRRSLNATVNAAAKILQQVDHSLVEKLSNCSCAKSPLFVSEIAVLAIMRNKPLKTLTGCFELIAKSRLGIVAHHDAIHTVKLLIQNGNYHFAELAKKGDYDAAIRSIKLGNGSCLNMIACSAVSNRDFVIAVQIARSHRRCQSMQEHGLPVIIKGALQHRQFDRAIDAAMLYTEEGHSDFQIEALVPIARAALQAGDFSATERAIFMMKRFPYIEETRYSCFLLIEELAAKYQFRLAFHLVSMEVKQTGTIECARQKKIEAYTVLAELAMNAGLTGLVLNAINDAWAGFPRWKWEIICKGAKKHCEKGDFVSAEKAVLMINGSVAEEVLKERDYLYFDLAEIAFKAGKLDQMILFLKLISPNRYWRMKNFVELLLKKLSQEHSWALLRAVETIKAFFPSAF